ncbi:MAG: hypothetical protein GXP11_09890 [Gammaproteobacteria bacterium]|nr:hypothetical protein [Gammaproteobacteria bacterium]
MWQRHRAPQAFRRRSADADRSENLRVGGKAFDVMVVHRCDPATRL